MIHLIDKDAVLAEIDKRQRMLVPYSPFDKGGMVELQVLKDKLNSFVVKEVDLDKEIDDYMAKEWEGIEEDKPFYDRIKNDLSDIAKHFFELGVNTSNPLTDVDLDSMQDDYVYLLESRGMEHDKAVIASASYANGVNDVLERFKAQKGE